MNITWEPDILGDPWQQRVLPIHADLPDDPAPVATLVRRAAEHSSTHATASKTEPTPGDAEHSSRRPAVLYIHGYNDYFFQRHVGDHFAAAGYDFYALDLRRCGRSWRTGQPAHYVTDMSAYFEEITSAMRIIRDEFTHDRVILLGHSTGGLTSALWCAQVQDNPELADLLPDALVLNSPWIALQGPWWWRIGARTAAYAVAPVSPQAHLGGLSPHYGRALHEDTGGSWEFDLGLKPHEGLPARAAWLRAVMRGHRKVHRGLGLRLPILVCTSGRSGNRSRYHDELLTTDSVLTAKRLRAAAPRLGACVTQHQFAGAHDLALSSDPISDDYLSYVTRWLNDQRTHTPEVHSA